MGKDGETFEAIIVDPDIEGRTRLRQATLALPLFGKVLQSCDPGEAIEKLKTIGRFDIIFISYRIGDTALAKFIRDARQVKSSRDAAIVMVLNRSEQGGSTIATCMIHGVNGFLFEPYSVDSLQNMTQIASVVRADREESRFEAGIALLVKQIGPQLDTVADLRARGHNAALSTRLLTEMCSVITSFEESALQYYFECLCSQWSHLASPSERSEKRQNDAKTKTTRRAVNAADHDSDLPPSDVRIKLKA